MALAKTLFQSDQVAAGNLIELSGTISGGIVSKTLIDTPGVKQILFAMDAEQSMSEHRVPMAATVQVLDGRMMFVAGGVEQDMRCHDWLLMPANTPHRLTATQSVRFLLTLIKKS